MFLFLMLILIFLYILSFAINGRARLFLKHLPTFTQYPFLGSMHLFIGGGEDILRRLNEASKKSDEKGLPFVIWFAHHPLILLSDPEDAKAAGNAFLEKPYFYNFGKMWLGDGLVTGPGKVWKENIKKLGGTFTRSVVNNYQEVFNLQAQRLVEKLRTEDGKSPFDARHYIAHKTLESICQTGLGCTDITENIATMEYYNAFNRALQLVISRSLNFLYHSDWIYRLSPVYKDLKKQIDIIHNVSNTVIKERSQKREEIKKQQRSNESENKSKFKSFLDILLDLSEKDPNLTEHQIRSEVDTVIVGGQETVASTLCFALLMIGCHPDVEARLHAEIIKVLGDRCSVDKEDLPRMVYCEAVINETLRMFPPFPGVMRYADRDLKLNSCTIPRGATVVINAWGAGRSERLWGPLASHFSPERWLSPREPCVGTSLAFSVGRRSCIGKNYAFPIMKTMLAHCVREFMFQSDAHQIRLKADVALRSISGHHLQVKLRNKHK